MLREHARGCIHVYSSNRPRERTSQFRPDRRRHAPNVVCVLTILRVPIYTRRPSDERDPLSASRVCVWILYTHHSMGMDCRSGAQPTVARRAPHVQKTHAKHGGTSSHDVWRRRSANAPRSRLQHVGTHLAGHAPRVRPTPPEKPQECQTAAPESCALCSPATAPGGFRDGGGELRGCGSC